MSLTYPTFLTFVRLALIPLVVYAVAHQELLGALIIFTVAVISDLLDGYLARKWHQESFAGACLDPLADKMLIIASYATLIFYPLNQLALPRWFLWVVLIKELLVLFGAAYFGLFKKQVPIRPLIWGKLSMVVQSVLVVWLLACFAFDWMPLRTLHAFVALVMLFLCGSLLQYAYQLFKKLF